MGKRASQLVQSKRVENLSRQQSKEFYQTRDWKQFRNKRKRIKRKQHEKIVLDVYLSNPENKPEDLIAFLISDNPLSEPHLKKGIIKVASVFDHKKRIRAGGSKFALSNLHWVTEEYHNRKSGQEAHE